MTFTHDFKKWVVLLLILLMTIISGCGAMGKSVLGWSADPVLKTTIDKVMDMRSAQLAREGLPTAVLLVSVLAEVTPNDADILGKTAFLHVALGLCVEDDNPEYASELYAIAYDYGLRALKTDKAFRKGLESGKTVSEMVAVLDEKYAGTLMWTSLGAGLNAMLNMDDPSSMMVLAPCLAMAKRSIALDDSYFYGLGNLFMAAYASIMPKMLDASCGPEKSGELFQMVREKTEGKFLFVDLFEARYLASLKNDRKNFNELLNRVLETDSGVLKGRRMFNEIAKMKAFYSLEHPEVYF